MVRRNIGMKKKILIVEDAENIRQVVKEILKGSEYIVIEAENGQKGIEQTEAHIPDIIITDLMMPVMNGFEFIKFLKTNEEFKNIPVIVLSALEQKQYVVQAIMLGANDYIVKPFKSSHFLERVKNFSDIKKIIQITKNIKIEIDRDISIIYLKEDIEDEELKILREYISKESSKEIFKKSFSININIYECRFASFGLIDILKELQNNYDFMAVFLTNKNTPINIMLKKYGKELNLNYL